MLEGRRHRDERHLTVSVRRGALNPALLHSLLMHRRRTEMTAPWVPPSLFTRDQRRRRSVRECAISVSTGRPSSFLPPSLPRGLCDAMAALASWSRVDGDDGQTTAVRCAALRAAATLLPAVSLSRSSHCAARTIVSQCVA